MRAQEFITESREKYNWDLHKPGFEFSQKINGITYTVKRKNQFLNVKARDKQGRKVGSTWFVSHQYKDALEAGQTFVDPEFRGQGIATNMYAVVRMLGANIHPSTTQSDDGKAMWSKWDQQGDAKHIKSMNAQMTEQGVTEGFSNDMSTEDMIAYLRRHHDTNLHQDYLDHINTFSKFVLQNIPVNSIKTDLPALDRAKVEQYKQMDFNKAPPIVIGGGYILDGYHRANVAKALGIPTIKAYVGVQGQPGVTENMDHSQDGRAVEELKSALLAKRDQLQSASDDQVYDIIDKIMKRISRSHSISGQKLHDMWVDRYKQIPDTWVMNEDTEQKPVIIYTDHRGATIDDGIKNSLRVTQIPVDKLRLWEKHKSMQDPKVADWVTNKLLPELKQNGKLKPLLVWNNNGQFFVIDGNHRLIAYQEAGYKGNVPVQLVPDNMITVSDTVPGQQGVTEDTQLPGDFKLMGQNLFLKNLARNLKQRYPDATVKLLNDRVTAYHNKGDDEALTVMGTEVMDSGYIGVGLDDAFTESFQGVLVPTIKQTTEQLLAANPGTRPALFLSTDNWNPDAWTHIATKLGYRLVADDESLDEQDVAESREDFEGITIEMKKRGHVLDVSALDDWGNNILGYVIFNIGDNNELDPQELEVDHRYQGQGIAKAIYDYTKSKGYTINRSWDQTDAGKGFWDKHRGEDVRVWENFADGRNPQDKGDSKRHGIPKHASLTQLDKIGHGSGRKAQLARWQANMRRGRAK